MRVLIAGATGYIGRALTRSLTAAGHEVVGLSRYPLGAAHTVPELVAAHGWAPTEAEPPEEAWAGIEGVVNLVGEPIAGRWTDAKKREIYDTRIQATRSAPGTGSPSSVQTITVSSSTSAAAIRQCATWPAWGGMNLPRRKPRVVTFDA